MTDSSFPLHSSARVPQNYLSVKVPRNHKLNKQNRRPAVFLPRLHHNLLELLPGPTRQSPYHPYIHVPRKETCSRSIYFPVANQVIT